MASVDFKLIDQDRGFKKLLKRLFKRKSPHVVVGVYGKKASEKQEYVFVATAAGLVRKKVKNPPTVGEVAAVHEFGAPSRNIPKRSFLRDTAQINERRIEKNLATVTERIVTGAESERTALLKFGAWFEGVVKKRIAAGIPPKLKPATIKRKGSSKPLIDTGQLRNSITSELRD